MAAVRKIGVSALVAFAGFAATAATATVTECTTPGQGLFGDKTTCTACEGNTYSTATDLNCKACPDGKVSKGDKSECCAVGYAPNAAKTACEKCGAGNYASASAETCEKCPVGTYSTATENNKCEVCPEGRQFAGTPGSTTKEAACPACTDAKSTKCYKDGVSVNIEAIGKVAVFDSTAGTCKCPAGPAVDDDNDKSWPAAAHEAIGAVGGLIVGSGATYFITSRASSQTPEAEIESQVLTACVIFTILVAAFAVHWRRRQGVADPQVELTETVAPAF